MIGFGDPFFSKEQAARRRRRARPAQSRASRDRAACRSKRRAAPQTQGVDSAELALLPRLPDTADELKSMALALAGRSRRRCCNLGKDANERTVKNTDLSRYRIIVFATHGLVPGDSTA